MLRKYSEKFSLIGFNSFTYIVTFAGGAFIGMMFPTLETYLANISEVLQKLFQLCVLPIVICSIVLGVLTLIQNNRAIPVYKLLEATLLICACVCGIGMVVGNVFHPGSHIDLFSNPEIARAITKASILHKHVWTPIEDSTLPHNFIDFLKKSIPHNIFFSLAKNQVLQVIVFSILFAIGLAKVAHREVVSKNFEIFYEVFKKIFEWILFFLPLFVFCSAASAVSKVGVNVFIKLLPYYQYLLLCVVIIFFANLLVMRSIYQKSIYHMIKDLKISLLVSFVSSPIAATIPVIDFFKKYKTSESITNALAPIFLFLGTFGSILYFVFTSIVISQIYGRSFTIIENVFLGLFSIITSFSTIGVDSDPDVFLESILGELDVPLGPISVLLTSINFIVMPFLNVLSTQTAILLLSLFLHKKDSQLSAPKEK